MSGTVLGVEVTQLGSINQTGPEEMFDLEFCGEFVHSNTPVYLGFLSNCEAIGIHKGVGTTFEGFAESGLVVTVTFEDLDPWNRCKIFGRFRSG